jgi:hypothetical protein
VTEKSIGYFECIPRCKEMERRVLEESWRRNRPVGPSLEVIDDDDEIKSNI